MKYRVGDRLGGAIAGGEIRENLASLSLFMASPLLSQ